MPDAENTILDLDSLLAGSPPAPPVPTPPALEPATPTLHQRLRDEVVAKARLIGWSDAELERLSASESESELIAARERIGRELSARFAVPPLYDTQPLAPPFPSHTLSVYR